MKKLLLVALTALAFVSAEGAYKANRGVQHSTAGGQDIHLYYNVNKSHFTSQGIGGSTNVQYSVPRSGYYLFTEECEIATIATAGDSAMLYVAQDNTVIDLGTHSIGETTGGTVTPLDVVVINADNVTLKNGTISAAAGGAGIRVAPGIKDVKIHNITINDCITEGIHIAGATGASIIRGVNISNCSINGVTSSTAEIYGIYGTYVEDLVIDNVTIGTIDAIEQNSNGVALSNCANALLKDVTVANCSTTTSGVLKGIELTTTTVSTLDHCCVKGNASADELYGIELTNGSNCNVLKNCDIFSNSSADTSIGVNITYSTAASSYNTVENCQVVYQTSTSETTLQDTVGFRSGSCVGNMFAGCTARGCWAADTNSVYGFKLDSSDGGGTYDEGAYIQNCTAKSNEANGSASGSAYGIYIYSGIIDAIVLDNKLFDNKGKTAGYGIYDANSDSRNLFQRNFAYHNMAVAGTIDNYYVLPDGNAEDFPVGTGHVNNFTIYEMRNENYNWEILG